MLLKAMRMVLREVPSASLNITAPISEGRKARRSLHDLGISGTFSWFESRAQLSKFLADCHIGVIPTYDKSRRFAYPTKLFEYLSAGLPVVATDIGGWTRIVTEMDVGIIVRPTATDLAQGIINLLQDPEKRYRFSKNAVQLLSTRFNANNQLKELMQTYARLQRTPISLPRHWISH
jgi:glycosyltransferase involved in cell wall biosynthesis